ncbi:alpha/beta fold hydrolase [Gorillibacterium massiliense]|uniref:alpha/beta fold hydrolase n=1 Tax=Gorillibacterium massiliense TaxID=1280390 RepID=UPI0004B21AC1|nr:alpha/beta fold hydrolase [Gorillibacterium massiliense]
MKKILGLSMVLLLLLSAMPVMASAASPQSPKVLVNQAPVIFADAQPYENNGTLLLPIRPAAEELGLKVSYSSASQEVYLSGYGIDAVVKVGSSKAVLNGAEKPFVSAAFMKKDRVYVPLSFYQDVLGAEAKYDTAKKEAAITSVSALQDKAVSSIISLFTQGDYQKLSDKYFSDDMKKSVPVSQLSAAGMQLAKTAGAFVKVNSAESQSSSGSKVYILILAFEKANLKLTLSIDANLKVNGLLFQDAPSQAIAPASVKEEEVIVGKDTAYPLKGTLTIPAKVTGPLPAVVLVQGSGPSDRNETADAYAPFRDLAWGLAEQGIAVLRYDKRTYTYGASYTPEMVAAITVKDETVDDAIAAAKLLKADPRIDPKRVYVIGHSLGGMLAPRIDAEGGDFAGLILLAGSPRPLWEIIHDQNTALLATMADSDPNKKTGNDLVEAEYAKAKTIATMSDDEAKKTTVFGLPATYFKEMDSHSAADYAKKLTKPVLVLQGQDDFQVYPDKDFPMWKDLLKGDPQASFKLYPGLNHFFVDYSGPGAGTTAEYSVPGTVSKEVITDIGAWILK